MSTTPVPGTLLLIGEPGMRAAFRRVTRGLSRRVRYATSARQAWEMLQREVPEVVIADEELPDTRGEALLDRIGRSHPEVKRILHASPARRAVAFPVLGKPATREELRDALVAYASKPVARARAQKR